MPFQSIAEIIWIKIFRGQELHKTQELHGFNLWERNQVRKLKGVPSQNVFFKGIKMSENKYVDKKKRQ